jgi:hypothetical protein
MRNYVILLIAAFIAYGCAASKKAVDISVGTWDYIVTDTPNGDTKGNFTISREGENYVGTLSGEQGTYPLNNIKVEGNILTYSFSYQGMVLDIKGNIEGSSLTGNVTVDYTSFPMTATRRE